MRERRGAFRMRTFPTAGFIFLVVCRALLPGQEMKPVAWWSFDVAKEKAVPEKIAGIDDELSGNHRYYRGVSGKALKLDGYTTAVRRRSPEVPSFPAAFTVEAWLAAAAFPWNWCPVVARCEEDAGFALEIGPDGELAMRVFSGSAWRMCISRQSLPLRQWTHVAGVFDPEKGLVVYIDGREQGRLEFQGRRTVARRADLVIGSVSRPLKPAFIHRENGTLPGWYSLDALLDELKIYDRALSGSRIARIFQALKPKEPPEIPPRVLPRGPDGPARFGAVYTRLRYYWEWDDLWRVADHPDIVVLFDKSPVRVVFWRGTRYSPAWVTENNLWMADQSVEAWNDQEGCFEHMQDRHCRTSHVRIIENTPARVVVHWRYALVSAHDHLWNVDARTGWGCWVDEYYYFYPDQTGIRKYTWQKGSLGKPRQFQESIPLTGPGQVQGDVIHEEYLTIANLEGERQVFRYVQHPSRNTEKPVPKSPNIQRHNLKSRYKPFIIFEPGGRMEYLRDMDIGALSRPGSCSHWPVGQMRCDGRTQHVPDRATSFLGFPITSPVIHEKEGRNWIASLYGMTDKPFDHLVSLARSWARAPALKVQAGSLVSLGYDLSQRAYLLEAEKMEKATLILDASRESPLVNACLLIRGWGSGNARVLIEGKPAEPGDEVRTGGILTLEGEDLVIWIAKTAERPLRIDIEPGEHETP
ncbi:MAG: LamG domain-containing protein [Candidatus Aminicenantales bacterium]